MALVWVDGFDYYSTSYIGERGYTLVNEGSISIASTTPRSGSGNYLRTNAESTSWNFAFPAISSFKLGFALRIAGMSTLGSNYTLGSYGNADSSTQFCLMLNNAGNIILKRGNFNGTTLVTSSNALITNTWYHIEVIVTVSNTVGTCEVKVNGSSSGWINSTGLDLLNTGSTENINRILFTSMGINNTDFDDLWLDDATSHGDCKVVTLSPTGAGNSSQWTPSSGSNYACVDESTPDTADYVETSTTTNRDSYAFGNLSSSAAIKGVQAVALAKKTDAGSRSIQLSARISSTQYDSADIALQDSSAYKTKIWDNSPATASAWTQSEVDNAEFGYELTV